MAEKLRTPQQAVVGSKTRSAGRTSISKAVEHLDGQHRR